MTGGTVAAMAERGEAVRKGQRLEYFTIAWNSLEALIAVAAGLIAGSVALVGFGLDSVIEVTSGAALLWRLHHEWNTGRKEQVESLTLRIVGITFLALSGYVAFESLELLMERRPPSPSLAGILLAAASVVVMPILARAKRRVAFRIHSGAMRADAKQTEFCMYLSAILLGGLLLNAILGWWWADPVAGIIMTPIIAKEGIDALRGKACACETCPASPPKSAKAADGGAK